MQEVLAIYSQSESESRMTVITGRRRVGKTMLALGLEDIGAYVR
jgi:AAA+ ATPase superfamily predicted ATPase